MHNNEFKADYIFFGTIEPDRVYIGDELLYQNLNVQHEPEDARN